MTPIDQIRKALEAIKAAKVQKHAGLTLTAAQADALLASHDALRDENAALKAERDAAVQRAAELGRALEKQRSIAIEASEFADVQRIKAAEMQADAMDVEIPEGWALYSADFSINANDSSRPGWVMLRRVGRNYTAWHALDDEAKEVTALYTQGKAFDYAAALKKAIRAIPTDPIRAIKE